MRRRRSTAYYNCLLKELSIHIRYLIVLRVARIRLFIQATLTVIYHAQVDNVAVVQVAQ